MNGASVCDIPLEGQDFKVSKVSWNPDGRSILIQDKNNLLIAYPHFTFLEEKQQDEDYDEEPEEEEEKVEE